MLSSADRKVRIISSVNTGNQTRQRLIGIALVALSAAIFGLTDGFSKVLAETSSVSQLVWARYAFALPILLMTQPSRLPDLFRTKHLRLQIFRGMTPLVVGAAMVLAVRYLPLADATVILFATPFFVVALSVPFLGEKVSVSSWIAVAAGFAAVLIVARPGLNELSRFAIFPLIGAVFYAALLLITRRIAAAGERAETTLAWTLLTGFVVSSPLAVINWQAVEFAGWLSVLAIGITFGAAQLMMIRGFANAPAALLAPLSYFQIVSAVIFGLVAFGEVPDMWTWLGILMIVGSGLYVVRQNTD
jgi:drug/metabolite transporter (DMT)-like permease